MHSEMKKRWGINVAQWQLYRARVLGRQSSEGSHEESFKHLKKCIDHLREINLGTFVKLQFQPRVCLDDPPTFKYLFMCFEAVKRGFLEGCRPFIGVDGCFLKGPFGRVMLSAVALDGNRGVLPIAFAIVDSECT